MKNSEALVQSVLQHFIGYIFDAQMLLKLTQMLELCLWL